MRACAMFPPVSSSLSRVRALGVAIFVSTATACLSCWKSIPTAAFTTFPKTPAAPTSVSRTIRKVMSASRAGWSGRRYNDTNSAPTPRPCQADRIVSSAVIGPSFDHRVGAQQDRVGEFDTKRFRSFHVYDQLELGWLLDGEIRRLRTFENFVYVSGRTAKQLQTVRAIRDEATDIDKVSSFVYGWKSLLSGELDDARSLTEGKGIDEQQKCLGMLTDDAFKSHVQLARIAQLD